MPLIFTSLIFIFVGNTVYFPPFSKINYFTVGLRIFFQNDLGKIGTSKNRGIFKTIFRKNRLLFQKRLHDPKQLRNQENKDLPACSVLLCKVVIIIATCGRAFSILANNFLLYKLMSNCN